MPQQHTDMFKFDDSVIYISAATIASMTCWCGATTGCKCSLKGSVGVGMSHDTIKSVIGYHGKDTRISRVNHIVTLE